MHKRIRMRVDLNQTKLVAELRKMGFSVEHTYLIGHGFPDICIGGMVPCNECGHEILQNVLVEIKQPGKDLSPEQKKFHSKWRGPIIMVHDIEDVRLYIEAVKPEIRVDNTDEL
jgi:hypothetical protein